MENRFHIPSEQTLRARESVVLDHFHDEVRQDWDDVLSTFPHPHYEIIPTLTVHDGDTAVRDYYKDTRVAFPDQDHEIIAIRHSADAVIVEFWLLGTMKGSLGSIPPSGRRHRTRMTALFIFDSEERLVCERIYFDTLTMLKQVMVEITYDPRTWLSAARSLFGLASLSSNPSPQLTDTAQFKL